MHTRLIHETRKARDLKPYTSTLGCVDSCLYFWCALLSARPLSLPRPHYCSLRMIAALSHHPSLPVPVYIYFSYLCFVVLSKPNSEVVSVFGSSLARRFALSLSSHIYTQYIIVVTARKERKEERGPRRGRPIISSARSLTSPSSPWSWAGGRSGYSGARHPRQWSRRRAAY